MSLGSGAFLLGVEQSLGYLSVDGVGGLVGIVRRGCVDIEFCELVKGLVFLHVLVGFPDEVADERRVTVDWAARVGNEWGGESERFPFCEIEEDGPMV